MPYGIKQMLKRNSQSVKEMMIQMFAALKVSKLLMFQFQNNLNFVSLLFFTRVLRSNSDARTGEEEDEI